MNEHFVDKLLLKRINLLKPMSTSTSTPNAPLCRELEGFELSHKGFVRITGIKAWLHTRMDPISEPVIAPKELLGHWGLTLTRQYVFAVTPSGEIWIKPIECGENYRPTDPTFYGLCP